MKKRMIFKIAAPLILTVLVLGLLIGRSLGQQPMGGSEGPGMQGGGMMEPGGQGGGAIGPDDQGVPFPAADESSVTAIMDREIKILIGDIFTLQNNPRFRFTDQQNEAVTSELERITLLHGKIRQKSGELEGIFDTSQSNYLRGISSSDLDKVARSLAATDGSREKALFNKALEILRKKIEEKQ
ncbi:MAG: hypothetical protein RDV48_12290 [Candidatus Eremiobacteraeota bacterium]|nr:hypothetical protein [Candidatus Eremiobacteraeota bacterium]